MFELNPDAKVTLIKGIGPNKVSVIIVDDFYKDPDAIRNFALKQIPITKEVNPELNGGVHKKRIFVDTNEVRDNLKETFLNLSSAPNIWQIEFKEEIFNMSWESAGFLCNSMNERDITGGCPHVDGDGCRIASLIYLNTEEECAGGTGLFSYQGNMKGIDGDAICPQEGGGEIDDWVCENKPPFWKLEKTVEMKYNRMVMYEGDVFHTQIFKRNMFVDYDRLTQVLFM